MRWIVIILALWLAACGTPHPEFAGVAPVRMAVAGSVFDIRVKGTRAEAIRLNPQYAPRGAAIMPLGGLAIEKVSGCRIRRMTGDQAQMAAWLDCGDPLTPLPPARHYDCDLDHVADGIADLYCRALE